MFPDGVFTAVAASDQIPVGHALAVQAGTLPVVLRRSPEGLSGWLNICAHRAAPVWLGEESAPCDRFRCPYHGWTYGTDGVLVRAPHFVGDPGPQRLQPVTVVERDQVIWVGTGEAAAHLELLDRLRDAGAPPFDPLVTHSVVRHTLRADWRLYVENYLEAYHVPFLHPDLARDFQLSSYEVRVHEGFVTHHATPRPGAPAAGFWAWVWPSTMLNVYEGGMNLERILPAGPGACTIEYTYLFDPEIPAADRDAALLQSATVTAEDLAICEAVQRNIDTGRAPQGPLSPRHETGITAFRALLEADGLALFPQRARDTV